MRLAVLGLGSMGRRHLESARLDGRFEVVAVCDRDAALAQAAAGNARSFDNAAALIDSGLAEALLVSTPHTRHVIFAQPALLRGMHVLVEKPVAVSVKGAHRLNRAFEQARREHPRVVFTAMFQQRFMPIWRALKGVIDAGELGAISRVSWVVTDWLRTDAYYASAGWRGTWAGEGGGVLMNQAPHNLDLLLWLTGLRASRVTAVASVGKCHPITTEDEVSAVIEFAPRRDGEPAATGHFVTGTGEAPGVNRLEIVGDAGSVLAEDGRLRVRRLRRPTGEVIRTGPPNLRGVEYDERTVDVGGGSPSNTDQTPFRRELLADFAESILHGRAPAVAGTDGLASLELANAMLLSGLTRRSVDLPLDEDEYQRFLEGQIARERG